MQARPNRIRIGQLVWDDPWEGNPRGPLDWLLLLQALRVLLRVLLRRMLPLRLLLQALRGLLRRLR
jgi:hypothetical protein